MLVNVDHIFHANQHIPRHTAIKNGVHNDMNIQWTKNGQRTICEAKYSIDGEFVFFWSEYNHHKRGNVWMHYYTVQYHHNSNYKHSTCEFADDCQLIFGKSDNETCTSLYVMNIDTYAGLIPIIRPLSDSYVQNAKAWAHFTGRQKSEVIIGTGIVLLTQTLRNAVTTCTEIYYVGPILDLLQSYRSCTDIIDFQGITVMNYVQQMIKWALRNNQAVP